MCVSISQFILSAYPPLYLLDLPSPISTPLFRVECYLLVLSLDSLELFYPLQECLPGVYSISHTTDSKPIIYYNHLVPFSSTATLIILAIHLTLGLCLSHILGIYLEIVSECPETNLLSLISIYIERSYLSNPLIHSRFKYITAISSLQQ